MQYTFTPHGVCARQITLDIDENNETIKSLRRLAVYTGICHVRTIDGSSYAADVQVSEEHSFDTFANEFSLTITRVDPEGLDGILETDWEVSA